MLSFVLGAIAFRKPNATWSSLWALVLALSTLVKPIAEPQILILIALLLLLPIPFGKRLRLVAVAALSFALLVGGWRLRNRIETGYWDLVTHKGRSMLWETANLTRPSTAEDYQEDARLARARDIVADTPRRVAEIMARTTGQISMSKSME